MTSSRTRTMYLAVSPACIQLIYVMNVVVRGQGCGCDSHSAYTSPLTSPVSGTLWKNRQMNIVNRTVIRRRATSRREREEHRLGWRAPRLRPQCRCRAFIYGRVWLSAMDVLWREYVYVTISFGADTSRPAACSAHDLPCVPSRTRVRP